MDISAEAYDLIDQDFNQFFEETGRKYQKTTKRKHKEKKVRGVAVKPSQSEKMVLRMIEPKTDTQSKVFQSYGYGNNLVLHGTAGTGKTFLSLYLALDDVYNEKLYNSVKIVRSAVPTRDIGFLPGKQEEKTEVYEAPYSEICNELFNRKNAYDTLKRNGTVEFITTSFLRGVTFRNSVIVIDEIANMTFQELDTIMTRVGENCRVILCGDFKQSDHVKNSDKNDVKKFLEILKRVNGVDFINFTPKDIVRSGFVKQWILACEQFDD